MKTDVFAALVARLDLAAVVLRENDCLLQAVARAYYVAYTYAVQAAKIQGIRFRQGVRTDEERTITHASLPDVIVALYTGQSNHAVLGAGPGITRAGRLSDRLAYRYVDQLQKDRKYADYGVSAVSTPFDATTTDERLAWAKHLVEDLRTLL